MIALPMARVFGASNLQPPTSIAGRLRVMDGRFADDAGYIGLRLLSEFDAVHRIRTGDEGDVIRRFERAAAAARNGVRVFGMAQNLFDLQPTQPGYWAAMARVVELAAQRGLRVELCLFADAQQVMPAHDERMRLVRDFGAFCNEHPSVLPQLTNEPAFNGWSSATDPALLELAAEFLKALGHDAFSIGDPLDLVESEETGEPLTAALHKLAAHSSILTLHGDRAEDPARFARWVDHLKGFNDFRSRVPRGVALIHDEPMGMAGLRDVPLANGRSYRRENRPEALVAGACVAAVLQIGFTTHYISSQNDDIPGLKESALAAAIPQSPDWQFINAGIGGSPVIGFSGFEKVRPATNGREAWAVAYGLQKGALTWSQGFHAERVFSGNNVEVWRATR